MAQNEINKLKENIEKVILGKSDVIRHVLAALLADGHVLIEDAPGLGKTYLARSLALSLSGVFHRIQFTPDLLPSDVTGVSIYNQRTRAFEFQKGPVFTNILLADELNRATPRTQSALLECMEERQVTVDAITHALPRPFFALATQNPIEHQGVYNLPEAQIDRFIIQITIGYPKHFVEMEILEAQKKAHPIHSLEPVMKVEDIVRIQDEVKNIFVDESVRDYIVSIVERTRSHKSVALGGSPRASLALYRMGQAMAYLDEAEYVLPDAIKNLVKPVLRHRLIIKPQAKLGGVTPDQILEDIIRETPVPTKSLKFKV
ncbi:MoxR family ATPase [Candidatus Sumerlaeota bacterium]|nr:MoxR family ATPase [Candidatus Sumerlaeota bacterium]